MIFSNISEGEGGGGFRKFANIHAKSRSSGNNSCDI